MDAIERRDADRAAESLTVYVRNAGDAALQRLDATQAK
jgi:DNA-binding GntR family transcriptional regulator